MNEYITVLFSYTGILTGLTAAVSSLILYIKLTTGKFTSNVNLKGKTVIVTGANAGIGYETALDLAQRGAKVILACRNTIYGKEAEEKIIKETDNKNVLFKHLDLASFKSIRQFVQEIKKSEKRLDILVNNAGGIVSPQETEDGLLLLMQTNYFGPFLLTILLLDLIKRTSKSRIVNVSSIAGKYAFNMDLNNLNAVPQSGIMKTMRVYSRSKLCNILFTIELAKKLQGTSVTTYSLHPGAVRTTIIKDPSFFTKYILTYVARPFLKNSREGAQTTIYCSIAEGIENLSGEHFDQCHVVERYKTAKDPELPQKLWKITEKILKLESI